MTILIIIGTLLLLGFLFLGWTAKNTVSGICPKCNNNISMLRSIGCCQHCGEPLQKEGENFVAVDPGFIADNTVFITNLSKLKPVSNWLPTWQDQCCVCGNAAEKKEKINIKTIKGQYGSALGPMNATSSSKFEVGYCAVHGNGVYFSFPAGMGRAKQKSECLLGFRSVDYYRDFFKQNRISSQTVRN